MRLPKTRLFAVVAVSAAALGGGAGVAQAHSANGGGNGGSNPNNGAFVIPIFESDTCEITIVFNKNNPGGFLSIEGDCFI